MVGEIKALCLSLKRGTGKEPVAAVSLLENWGLEGDAHGGSWHRQVSLLSYEKVQEFNAKGGNAAAGAFGENILVAGIDFAALPVGTRFICGSVILELTQIGKECHQHCQIFQRVGDCIMPREGVFARVLQGGPLQVGARLQVELPSPNRQLRAAVLTLSDKGAAGERVDTSGPKAAQMLREAGYEVVEELLLPDEEGPLIKSLLRLSHSRQVDLIITSGGTGLSPRDITPEATMKVATRNVPGIAEAIRAGSMAFTPRAMLSRGVSVLHNNTLIINLPGSTKAVAEGLAIVLPTLDHGLRLLAGTAGECGR